MKRFFIAVGTILLLTFSALGQTGDLGAQIVAQDTALGTASGNIQVNASGTISEGKVSLSAGHNLVCANNVTISLDAGSYLYQNSNTQISNCTISSTATAIKGEIQSAHTDHVELHTLNFVGGGNSIYFDAVSNLVITDTTITSITASNSAKDTMSGIYLFKCAGGQITNLHASNFVFPVGASYAGVIRLDLSSDITITNTTIQNVDASFVGPGAAAILIQGSKHTVIDTGVLTDNANMDGILSQTFGPNLPSSYVTISNVNSSRNGAIGVNHVPGVLGDGLDIINSSHVSVSHCTLIGNGSPPNKQPGIWIFIDDGVEIADTEVSDGSTAGIAAAGSRNVLLIRDTVNRNKEQGVFAEPQGGDATNVGAKVTWTQGISGGFGISWAAGTPFSLNGLNYQIASVEDNIHLTLSSAPPDHSSPVHWSVETTEDIRDSVINDNALAQVGGQEQVGISWAGGTNGTISGVTSGNTGTGFQIYGLEFANTAYAYLDEDDFSGNQAGGDGILGSSQFISANSLGFPPQSISTSSAVQTITLTAGAVVPQGMRVDASGDFSQTNNCGATLLAFTSCQIQVTFTPTVSGTRNGTLTISDSAPNSPLTIALAGAGTPKGFTITGGSANSATVTAGGVASYSLSLGGAGEDGTATLTCTGAPTDSACDVPPSVAFTASQATPFSVTVTTHAPVTAAARPSALRRAPWFWAFFFAGWVLVPAGAARRKSRRLPIWWLLAATLFLGACGGSGGTPVVTTPGTPKGTYTLTVTATVAGQSEQIMLTLVVQ